MSLQDLGNPGLLWFIVGLVLLITEMFTPALILMFFGFGAWIVAVLCLVFNIELPAQLAVFGVSSIVLLAFFRRKLKPVFLGYVSSKHNASRNMDDYIGKEAVVLACIEPGRPGKVEFKGVAWDAESEGVLDIDARVKIIGRNGLKLKVMPL